MYEYTLSFLGQYVEMKTYLSLEKLYGKIIKVTPFEISLLRDHIDKHINDNYVLYIPISSLINIEKL